MKTHTSNLKMLAKCYVHLFLALITSLCNASKDVMIQENQTIHINELANSIKIFIDLPPNSKSIHFDCRPGGLGKFVIHQRKSLELVVHDYEFVACKVTLGHLQAIFKPEFDQNGKVQPGFWIINIDGFFHTFDHIHFIRKASWFPTKKLGK